MTEQMAINEIIKEVCSGCYGSESESGRCSTCGFDMAIRALRENEQYRAIGTVKEIKIKQAEFAVLSERYLNDVGKLWEYQSLGTVEELQALKEKSEKGLLLELPCKVGDTVWCIVSAGTKIVECTVLWIEKHRNGVMVFSLDGGLGDVVLAHLGEKWFLTKEEAEKKLNCA